MVVPSPDAIVLSIGTLVPQWAMRVQVTAIRRQYMDGPSMWSTEEQASRRRHPKVANGHGYHHALAYRKNLLGFQW